MSRDFHDQMGRAITINWPPKKIISLVPSQTELLYSLGLRDEVIGITKFCVHPQEWFRSKPRVGGTKKIDFDKINSLEPDLIIANKEENEEVQIKQLIEQYPVWISDIRNLNDALVMIHSVGELVNKEKESNELINEIRKNFKILNSSSGHNKKAAYFIWKDPFMVAGGDTFITNMLKLCGLHNVFENVNDRYPVVTKEEIQKMDPEVVLLSSEPFPFSFKHINEFSQICPNAKVMLVDGEYFSWYGSRLLGAPAYFNKVMSEIEL